MGAAEISSASRHRRSRLESDRIILNILAQGNRPLSAYDISDRVGGSDQPMVPNQVYRILARLIDQGDVVRIESLNAYCLRRPGSNACLICIGCHTIAFVALPDVETMLGHVAQGRGFGLSHSIIEAKGKCDECRRNGGLR